MYEEFGMIKSWMNQTNYDLGLDKLLEKYNMRKSGSYQFTKRDHCEALLLSVLSANRPWIGIEAHLGDLKEIFRDYDPDFLISADPNTLYHQVTAIGCGNRRLNAQMHEIEHNVGILNIFEEKYGTADFAADCAVASSNEVLWVLADKKSRYKMYGVGIALAAQYLKNVGVDLVKPDIHIRRIIQRFGWTYHYPEEMETIKICKEVADQYGVTQTEVGTTLWQFCAVGYIRICGETPSCEICPVNYVCNFGKLKSTFA